MLVLSRREDQKVSFPDLGISVQVLRVKGSNVRLGVDAPIEVRVLRDELKDHGTRGKQVQSHTIRLPQQLRHELRNELNSISLALHLFKQEVDSGYHEDAKLTFDKLVDCLENIRTNEALSAEGLPTPASSFKTLLVEDAANEREMLAGFLRLHGFDVATASDGLEALQYLQAHAKPTAILLDMLMPRCDGTTLVRRIRENESYDKIKLFAISGSTPEDNKMNFKESGLNGWFTKPLNPKSLIDAMVQETSNPGPNAA